MRRVRGRADDDRAGRLVRRAQSEHEGLRRVASALAHQLDAFGHGAQAVGLGGGRRGGARSAVGTEVTWGEYERLDLRGIDEIALSEGHNRMPAAAVREYWSDRVGVIVSGAEGRAKRVALRSEACCWPRRAHRTFGGLRIYVRGSSLYSSAPAFRADARFRRCSPKNRPVSPYVNRRTAISVRA